VTLAETIRESGKVRRKHLASIGWVTIKADHATTVRERLRLWPALHKTLSGLYLRSTHYCSNQQPDSKRGTQSVGVGKNA
jgi:hypothetical protein